MRSTMPRLRGRSRQAPSTGLYSAVKAPRPATKSGAPPGGPVRVETAALFAGIGGIELGLAEHGFSTTLFCEWDAAASAVLEERFPECARFHGDVRTLESIPRGVEFLTAGFPCQDLSQAGKTAGIEGARSGLVGEVFRLLRKRRVPRVLIENVPFMLQLGRGRALDVIMNALEELGYSWAYRVIDARAFGLPQRRERVYILAALDEDPRDVLLSDDTGEPEGASWKPGRSFGFYWTEGIRGLGAAVEAIPTLKGGSTIGIPSAPAIVLPDGSVGTPDIRDAERLQGFPIDWTLPAAATARASFRWKLVGNAVNVSAASWIGSKLVTPAPYDDSMDAALHHGASWPRAAWSRAGKRFTARVSAWPIRKRGLPIHEFLRYPLKPLSAKATAGFLSRARRGSLRFPPHFLATLDAHLRSVAGSAARPTRVRARAS